VGAIAAAALRAQGVYAWSPAPQLVTRDERDAYAAEEQRRGEAEIFFFSRLGKCSRLLCVSRGGVRPREARAPSAPWARAEPDFRRSRAHAVTPTTPAGRNSGRKLRACRQPSLLQGARGRTGLSINSSLGQAQHFERELASSKC